eukprot:s1138_g1.t3
MADAAEQIAQAEAYKQEGNTRFKEQNFRGALGSYHKAHPRRRVWGAARRPRGQDMYRGARVEDAVDCAANPIQELWEGGRLWKTFNQRVQEFDKMGFSHIPVTSVFTAAILSGLMLTAAAADEDGVPQNPFMDVPGKALVNTFLRQAMWKYGRRYAFTFNVYPYFDPNLHMNPGSRDDCSEALKRATCWQGATCLGPAIMIAARRKMQQLTGNPDDLFWIGEIGWSSPRAQALHTEMKRCQEFSSLATFQTFYSGFLQWDLSLPGVRAPDHIFYFTLRDALNFGIQEFFGLLLSCQSLGCKIATHGFAAEECELPQMAMPMSWRTWAFIALGIFIACAAASTCDQSSNGSLPTEGVQEEVKGQVQMVMQTRHVGVASLQSENQELRRLLSEMLEVLNLKLTWRIAEHASNSLAGVIAANEARGARLMRGEGTAGPKLLLGT